MDSKYDEFIKTTEDPALYYLEDVRADGICGFRTCALNLNLYNTDVLTKLTNSDFKDINNIDLDINITSNKKEWGYHGKLQKLVSDKLRIIIAKDIIKNWNKKISDEYGFNTIGKLTLAHHEFDTKSEYKKEYLIEKEENCWIGIPELLTLSNILKIPIYIYSLIRFFKKEENERMVKLQINGKIPINTRFRIVQILGMEYIGTKHPINLLFEYDKNGLNHYLFIKKIRSK